MKNITGIQAIYHDYDLFFIDIWGVIHNGSTLFPTVLAVFELLKQANKATIILSNAPRLAHLSKVKLEQMGLHPNHYTDLYTSGEQCHRYLKQRLVTFYSDLGTTYYHLGNCHDLSIIEDLDFVRVSAIENASFFLMTGTKMGDELFTYEDMLQQGLIQKLPFVCANRDKLVRANNQNFLCAGAVADHYEKMGGHAFFHGKPDTSLYEEALATIPASSIVPKSRMIMIGDSLTTDIQGAINFGIDSLLIGSGIHYDEINNHELSHLIDQHQMEPTYFLSQLMV